MSQRVLTWGFFYGTSQVFSWFLFFIRFVDGIYNLQILDMRLSLSQPIKEHHNLLKG
jgi:hypothetical protein